MILYASSSCCSVGGRSLTVSRWCPAGVPTVSLTDSLGELWGMTFPIFKLCKPSHFVVDTDAENVFWLFEGGSSAADVHRMSSSREACERNKSAQKNSLGMALRFERKPMQLDAHYASQRTPSRPAWAAGTDEKADAAWGNGHGAVLRRHVGCG